MLVQTTSTATRPASSVEAHHLSGPIEMMGATMTFARNCEIYGEGEPVEFVYKVVTGAVRTSRVLADGRRQIGGFYLPGDVFGIEIGAEHAFAAEAISATKVVVVRRRALMHLASSDGGVAHELWTLMGRELARAQEHLLLLVKTAQERVVGFLFEMAARRSGGDTVELPMSRQDIADYLGLTIETVSRTFSQLQGSGCIAIPSCRRIVLRDADRLLDLCG
jgi:CRP/FNR family nitrogen fixation transcriptional regulator